MKKILYIFFTFSHIFFFSEESWAQHGRVVSSVDSSHAHNMVLEQSFVVNVPVDSVWNAYTTRRGWESWATAKAEVDLRINGLIRTSYDNDAVLGDSSTIVLHLINYVPYKMLTLQAEVSEHFPDFMKADNKELYNTILFEAIDSNKTKVTSYGMGYKKNEKYLRLMQFFIQGNEQSFINLITYLETGKPSVKY